MGRDFRPAAVSSESRDEIVAAYAHLVRPIARSIARRVPGVSLEDLEQAGALGLIDAAARYSPERDATFPAYVRQRVRGAMLDSLGGGNGFHYDVPLDGHDRAGGPSPEELAVAGELGELLNGAVARLSGRQRCVVCLRYGLGPCGQSCDCGPRGSGEGLSQRQAAAVLGVSQAAIHDVETRAILRLRLIVSRPNGDYSGVGNKLIAMPRPSAEQVAAIVDELGGLKAKIAELKGFEARYERLREQVVGWYDGEAAGRTFSLEGVQYAAEVSARSLVREIRSMQKLFQRLGQRKFLRHCAFPLAALDEIMAPADQGEYVVARQTGARRLKVFARLETAA